MTPHTPDVLDGPPHDEPTAGASVGLTGRLTALQIDRLVAEAEALWEHGRGAEATLERLAARVAPGDVAGLLSRAEWGDVRRALLMVEVSRRLGGEGAVDLEALRAELLGRFPHAPADVEATIELAAMLFESEGDGEEVGTDGGAAGGHARAEGESSKPVRSGDRIEKYTIGKLLGQGSFGEVWQAWDTQLQRAVALKLLLPGRADNQAGLDRFIAEARAAASLDHPHVVKVHGAGRFAEIGRYYIDAQLVSDAAPTAADPKGLATGQSLEEFVQARVAQPAAVREYREIAGIMEKVASGVAAAHAQGVLHRDIKPANILLTPSGRPLIADFGLSVSGVALRGDRGDRGAGGEASGGPANATKSVTESVTNSVTATVSLRADGGGRIVGTPAFMAPEQARGERATPASDVYGLGATLRYVLTGKPPYLASGSWSPDARWDVIEQVRRGTAETMQRACPACPAALCAIVDRAMDADPARRYASADAMATDLRAWLEHRPIVAAQSGLVGAAVLAARRNVVPVAILAGALAIIASATVVFVVSVLHQRDRAVVAEGIAEASLADTLKAKASAEQERDRAVAAEKLAAERLVEQMKARQTAQSVTDFLLYTIAGGQIARGGPEMTIVAAVKAAVPRVERTFKDQPKAEASVREIVGMVLSNYNYFDEAIVELDRALALRLAELGPDASETVRCRIYRAVYAAEKGEGKVAEREVRLAIRDGKRVLGEGDRDVLGARKLLADKLMERGDYDGAEAQLEGVVEAMSELHGELHEDAIDARRCRARLLWLTRQKDKAIEAFTEVLDQTERLMGVDSSAALSVRSQLGGLYMDAGLSEKADELLTACLPRLEALFGIGHGFTITAASNLAMLRLFHYYKPQAAIDIAQRFEEPSSKKYGPDHSTTLRLRCVIGEALIALDRRDEALAHSSETFERAMKSLGKAHPDVKIAGSIVYGAYAAKGDVEGMDRFRAYARRDQPAPPPKPDADGGAGAKPK